MSYSKVNLQQVEDSAAKHGVGESQEARFPREALGAEQVGMNYLRVKPGQQEAFAHRHQEVEEIVVVLSGSGSIELDGEAVELAPLDALRVPPGVTRRMQGGDQGLDVLVFGVHRKGDGEIIR